VPKRLDRGRTHGCERVEQVRQLDTASLRRELESCAVGIESSDRSGEERQTRVDVAARWAGAVVRRPRPVAEPARKLEAKPFGLPPGRRTTPP